MPSPELIEAHRVELNDINAVAQADLVEQWRSWPLDDAQATQALATAAAVDVVETYGSMAAGAGADFYMEARAEAGVRGSLTQRLVVPVIREQIAANVGWSIGPLYGVTEPETALRRLSGALQRLVTDADRVTVLTNVRRDPAQVRWYRRAAASACAFCAMVASRGDVYRSEQSGDFASHRNCKCSVVPLFPGESHMLPAHYEQFGQDYDAAVKALRAEGATAINAKPVLAKMRELSGRA